MRDKDAVNAAVLVCEMAANYKAQGLTLLDKLEQLREEFGFYAEDFGGGALVVRQAPFDVDPGDIEDTLREIGGRLLTTDGAPPAV